MFDIHTMFRAGKYRIFIFLVLVILTGASCSSRKSKIDRTNIIPAKDLTDIMTDIYLTDGLLVVPKVRQFYTPDDSLSAYRDIARKHGYTYDALEKTMKFYFVKKPKQLIKIYDQVLARLSEMESRFDKEASLIQSRISNLWKGREVYLLPDPEGNDSTLFDITVQNSGRYTLSYTITVYPDDQTYNPGLTAYTCFPDSIENGKRQYIETIPYSKDGLPHFHSYVISLTGTKLHLRGWLYDYGNNPAAAGAHATIENISVVYGRME